MFEVGELVQCIDASPCRCCQQGSGEISLWRVYTVAEVLPPDWEGTPGLKLVEVSPPNHDDYSALRFRPQFALHVKRQNVTIPES